MVCQVLSPELPCAESINVPGGGGWFGSGINVGVSVVVVSVMNTVVPLPEMVVGLGITVVTVMIDTVVIYRVV